MARAKQVGDDRVVLGVHHPSDVAIGVEVAKRDYAKMLGSQKFQQDLKMVHDQLVTAQQASCPIPGHQPISLTWKDWLKIVISQMQVYW